MTPSQLAKSAGLTETEAETLAGIFGSQADATRALSKILTELVREKEARVIACPGTDAARLQQLKLQAEGARMILADIEALTKAKWAVDA